MVRWILCLLACSLPGASVLAKEMKSSQKEGQAFAKNKLSSIWESAQSISTNDFLSLENKGKKFSPSQAKETIKRQQVESDILSFILSPEVQTNQREKEALTKMRRS